MLICHFIFPLSANLVMDNEWLSCLVLIFQIVLQNAKKKKDLLLRFWATTAAICLFFLSLNTTYRCGFLKELQQYALKI